MGKPNEQVTHSIPLDEAELEEKIEEEIFLSTRNLMKSKQR